MNRSERFYSRLVRWLKVLLPLIALGILSTVFLLARSPDAERQVPFATVDGITVGDSDVLSDPSYVGVSPNGSAIHVTAKSVEPEDATLQQLDARELSGLIETQGGRRIETIAALGHLDFEARQARFDGSVEVFTSDGFDMAAEDLVSHLDRVEIVTERPVRATTPFGRLDAGRMTVSEGAEAALLLVFQGGVNLLYAPEPKGDR